MAGKAKKVGTLETTIRLFIFEIYVYLIEYLIYFADLESELAWC